MSLRVCAEAGCPELSDTTRCAAHARVKDQARGTRQQRGYGVKHDRLRKQWAPKVALGTVNCWRCGKRLSPLEPWDLGHVDGDKTRWNGPECVPCNRSNK